MSSQPWIFAAAEVGGPAGPGPDAVLFDRDGTLIEDVPYNANPALVRPRPHARAALDLLRARGVAIGVVSNQSGAALGRVSYEAVAAIRKRVELLLGDIAVWAVCPHAAEERCGCRKPAPGLIHAACSRLGVAPHRAAVVGDIGSDMAAARTAGARGVLVPTPATRPEEISAAREWAPDLLAAVRALAGTDETAARS
jgi:D-glycero-D-manno-heptose 1,7-bisphosphate phosphatase